MALCPSCGNRKGRRHCPALEQWICPSCCGSKRQVEIRCPDSCGWLQGARAHPPAVVQRQYEQDAQVIVPLIEGLEQDGYDVLMALLQGAVTARTGILPIPLDADLRDAVTALTATAETASRGVLYEHVPDGPVAARLARAMTLVLQDLVRAGVPRLNEHASVALGRTRQAMRMTEDRSPRGPDVFFQFLGRVLEPRMTDPVSAGSLTLPETVSSLTEDRSRIILP